MAKVEIKGSLISELGEIENPTGNEMIPVETESGNGYVKISRIAEGKVSGTGIKSIQVVTELPETPDASTLYFIVNEEESV